ncbi:Carbohydrate binding domain-containing protein [Micromonospora sediminicola]|uniref:Carbohydrate binding domain-containing protein n=1 Tax=Micromonospora sediminicola TaxID=946078 RepID=A0A1A9BAD3_9ACTN|nr:glycosyl hydrolase family 18 protein [Micromonospora sediminicola]SBT65934.1 Carbohydrate binding domain-containing protein [Micromonospora sediminicola]
MKLRQKILALAAVTVTATALAVAPMTTSSAAAACYPAWSSSAVYVGGGQASYQGVNYQAKWWTQNENPATHSGQWDVWANQGTCGGTTPTTPPPTGPTNPPPAGRMAAAPYVYPGWGNPPAPSTITGQGVRAFTVAFVLANGCNPVWDGEGGLTGGVHESWINQAKAAGATIVPSIGGWQGNKLGPNCATPEALAGAYQKVINTFGLKAIEIDIENYDEFENYTVADRIVSALGIIKRNNPGVTTILTFGTTTTGPNVHGVRLINQARALNANVDVFTIMPFDFGGGADMYTSTRNAAEGLKNQLKSTFGWNDQTAYAHMGISGMNGLSDQQEVTTPETWTRIRDYARSNGLARFTFWAVNRDRGCAGGGVVSNCSGIAQSDWEFSRISAGF